MRFLLFPNCCYKLVQVPLWVFSICAGGKRITYFLIRNWQIFASCRIMEWVGRHLKDHSISSPLPWTRLPPSRLIRSSSNLASNVSKDGTYITSLDNLDFWKENVLKGWKQGSSTTLTEVLPLLIRSRHDLMKVTQASKFTKQI